MVELHEGRLLPYSVKSATVSANAEEVANGNGIDNNYYHNEMNFEAYN